MKQGDTVVDPMSGLAIEVKTDDKEVLKKAEELGFKVVAECTRCGEKEHEDLLTINGECDTCHNDK